MEVRKAAAPNDFDLENIVVVVVVDVEHIKLKYKRMEEGDVINVVVVRNDDVCCVVSPLLPKIVLGIDSTDHLAGRRHSNGQRKRNAVMGETTGIFSNIIYLLWGFIRS